MRPRARAGNWGQTGGDLLVGNFAFGDSVIDALNPSTFAVEGTMAINDGGQSPGGLWSLVFGGGGDNGNPDTLFIRKRKGSPDLA